MTFPEEGSTTIALAAPLPKGIAQSTAPVHPEHPPELLLVVVPELELLLAVAVPELELLLLVAVPELELLLLVAVPELEPLLVVPVALELLVVAPLVLHSHDPPVPLELAALAAPPAPLDVLPIPPCPPPSLEDAPVTLLDAPPLLVDPPFEQSEQSVKFFAHEALAAMTPAAVHTVSTVRKPSAFI